MPCAKTHAIVGAAAGVLALAAVRRKSGSAIRIEEVIVFIVTGLTFGLLADLIEPATNPNHRGIAHSLLIAAAVALLICFDTRKKEDLNEQASLFICAGVAYLSHLALDACTPKGLPIW